MRQHWSIVPVYAKYIESDMEDQCRCGASCQSPGALGQGLTKSRVQLR